jgi:hypothetical protein
MPLYITCAYKEEKNLMVYDKLFDGGKDSRTNGGYNIFDVFVKNYLNIFKEYRNLGIITNDLYKKEQMFSFNFIMNFYYQLVIRRNNSQYKIDDAKSIIIHHFGRNNFYFKLLKICMLHIFSMPQKILKELN